MEFIKINLRNHGLAFILAIFIGVISIFPQVYVRFTDPQYKGIQMFGTDAEYDYVSSMNSAQYSDYSRGPFPPDQGREYYLAPKLGERTIAWLAQVLHIGVIDMNVFFKLGPTLLYLIFYFWLLEMFSSSTIALLAPLFIILGIDLLNPGDLIRFVSLRTSLDSFLPYTRPINPQISSLFLFVGIWAIYRLMKGTSRLSMALLLGLLAGISLYIYLYTWMFLTVLSGLYFLYFLLKKQFEKAKYFFVSLAVNGIMALPFFLNLLRAHGDADYIDTSARIGLLHSHAPVLGILFIVGYVAILFCWPSIYRDVRRFFLFLFSALAIVLNQQIITGAQLQPGHFHWYITKPLIAILIVFLGLYWLERLIGNKKLRTALMILLGTVFLANGILVQRYSYQKNYPVYQDNQRYAALVAFLNTTYPEQKTIWTSPDLGTLILAYTRHNAPDSFFGPYHLDSQAHLRDMLFLEYRLRKIAPADARATMQKERDYVASKIFGIHYREASDNEAMLDNNLDTLALDYGRSASAEALMKSLHIDLIVVDKKINTGYDYGQLKLSVVKDFGDVVIYEPNSVLRTSSQ